MVFLAFIGGIAGWCARRYWMRLGDEKSAWRKRYWPWFLQGFVAPCLAWSLVNIGWSDALPPLVPQIVDLQQANAPWAGVWVTWSFMGAFFIWFYWSAITYIWMVLHIIDEAEEKAEVLFNVGILTAIFGLLAGMLVHISGWVHVAAGICLTLLPVVHFTIDQAEKPVVRATYSKAIAQRKRGKIKDAEIEVIQQLEKVEEDFDGWLMLAELYAREYRNLEDAARVVLDICRHPQTQPYQVSVACHKLAEWQLEIGENPLAARAALELLQRRLPSTHFAREAEQRLRQIPRTFEEFDELKQPKRIRLPSLSENLNPNLTPTLPSRAEPAAEANRFSEKLTHDPDDIPTREKLAQVLAEKLGKIDVAVEQLKLLTEMPEASDEQKAKWLAQIASWEFNRTGDKDRFQSALRQIVRDYPQTTHAFAAQRRLYLLEMDFLERQYAT